MATNIPLAREILESVLVELRNAQLKNKPFHQATLAVSQQSIRSALSYMTREIKHPNARMVSRKITREIVEEVLRLINTYPRITDLEAANYVNINPGRANEIRNGLRTPENPGMSGDGLNKEIAEAKARGNSNG